MKLTQIPLVYGSGNVGICLLRVGASYTGLSQEQISDLFRHACLVGDVSVVQSLLEKG